MIKNITNTGISRTSIVKMRPHPGQQHLIYVTALNLNTSQTRCNNHTLWD